ncbi:F0F1 ATP synthase subunit B [Candidatus Daviesbacteria bacterium]|nr:F0F1 ATP synthase subunit B [Candidatus Daviesbacteria bacterium]
MEILEQFGINPILLAAQVVNFFILLFILKKFLYKPILKVLEERKRKIDESLKNAESIEKRLLETEEEKEKILTKASLDAQKFMDETKKELEAFKEEMKQNAQKEAEQIIKKGQEIAKAETEKMEQQVMGRIAEVVAVAMEKVAGKVLDKKDQKEAIERSIRNIS